jgi:hypothetical protein
LQAIADTWWWPFLYTTFRKRFLSGGVSATTPVVAWRRHIASG